jgi:hypothetical protein
MKVLVIFLFFLGLYMISIAQMSTQNNSNEDAQVNDSRQRIGLLSGRGEKVSEMYAGMFNNSGPWMEKFIYNHPEEPKTKEAEKTKMKLFTE